MTSFRESVEQQANEEWVLWMADVPLFSLLSTNEPQPTSLANTAVVQQTPFPSAAVQRNQYNAVVQRFNKALKQAANFSNWNSE